MTSPFKWHDDVTFFMVKFIVVQGTTILRICMFSFLFCYVAGFGESTLATEDVYKLDHSTSGKNTMLSIIMEAMDIDK